MSHDAITFGNISDTSQWAPFHVVRTEDGVDIGDPLAAIKKRIERLEIGIRQDVYLLRQKLIARESPQRHVQANMNRLQGELEALACITGTRRLSQESERLGFQFGDLLSSVAAYKAK